MGWTSALAWSAAGVIAYLASLGLRWAPGVSEFYALRVGPLLTRPLSLLTGFVPFSVAEAILIGYVAVNGFRAIRALGRGRARGRRVRALVGGGARRVLRDVGVVAVAFYVLWGFNYARLPYEARAGWPAFVPAEQAELLALATQAVEAANAEYRSLHGSVDAGVATASKGEALDLEDALTEGWARAAGVLGLDPRAAGAWGRGKRPWASGLLARFGIAGIYVPWTGEPHTLRGYPAVRAVHSLAHEQAHQRGFAIEADASFIGFVVAAASPSSEARYSAAVYAATRLLSAVGRLDPVAAGTLGDRLLPGISRDLADVRAFWDRYRWAGTGLGSAVNDRYLRANRVPGGVGSYARADRLLIEFARQRGGRLLPLVGTDSEAGSGTPQGRLSEGGRPRGWIARVPSVRGWRVGRRRSKLSRVAGTATDRFPFARASGKGARCSRHVDSRSAGPSSCFSKRRRFPSQPNAPSRFPPRPTPPGGLYSSPRSMPLPSSCWAST